MGPWKSLLPLALCGAFAAAAPAEPMTAWLTFVEYPHVAVDGKDRVWLLFRLENEVHAFYTPPGLRAQSYATWHWFATQYDGRRWTAPILLAESHGRQDMRPDSTRGANGELLVAFAADGRTRRFPYVPVDYDVLTASLAGFGAEPGGVQLAPAKDLGVVAPVDADPELLPLPRTWSVGGKDYRLVLGDTHRHTDISRCMNGRDGSLRDAYRYALNACALDWLAISDHDQDLLKHRNDRTPRPRQDYDWWRSQEYCDLYSISGRFLALYGYEHAPGPRRRVCRRRAGRLRRAGALSRVHSPGHSRGAARGGPSAPPWPARCA